MALINYDDTTGLRPQPPLPGGLNDPAALAQGAQAVGAGVASTLRGAPAALNGGNPNGPSLFPQTTQALRNAGTNFSQNVGDGNYGRAAGQMMRDTALTAQSGVDDLLFQPSRAIANAAGPFVQGLRGGLTGAPAGQPQATQSQVRAVDNSFQSQPGEEAGPPVSAMQPAVDPNAVLRTGNSFSNAAAVPAGPSGLSDTGVSTADRVGQLGRDAAHSRDMATLQGGSGPTMAAFNTAIDPNRNADFNDGASMRTALGQTTWSKRGGTQVNPAAEAFAGQIGQRAKLREMSLQNEGRYAEARLRDATDRRGQDIQAATTNRGQDVTLAGQQMTARTAANAARLQQMNTDRTYNLDVAKYGTEQAKTNFDQRIKSRDDVEKQIGGMIPAGPDGKPDASAHAAAMTSVNNAIAQRQTQLQAQIAKGGPNAAAAQKEADALEKDPYGALGQDNIRKLTVGAGLTNTINSTATGRFNPFGTAASGSTAPVTSLRPNSSLFGTDYEATHADGSHSVIPARKLRDPNGNISPDYNLLMQK